MEEKLSEAISKFIIDTSPTKIDAPKNKYKKSSHTINYKGSKKVNSEIIINVNGIGHLRELVVVSPQKMNPYLEIDGENTLRSIESWDELAQITLYTTTIVAQTNGTDFILSFNNLRFIQNIFLRIEFPSGGIISRVFGVYDLCEEL